MNDDEKELYPTRPSVSDGGFFDDSSVFNGTSVKDLDGLLENAFSNNGGPGYLSPLGNILYGIKILGNGVELAPVADDTIGLVFVSRPLLNMSDSNMRGPRFSKFYGASKNTLLNYIRGLLDKKQGAVNCHPALNNNMPWITAITNLVMTSDGFPDLRLEVNTTQPGIRQEVHQLPTGILDDNGPNTINMTYRNVKSSIIQTMFETWEHYIPEVRLGDHGMEPYDEALRGHWADWDCRIYHFIVNANMINIEQCIMTVESIPTTFPQGSLFAVNTQEDSRRSPDQDTFSIQFSSVGSRANTLEVIDSFNQCTYFFCEDLRPEVRDKHYRKLSPGELLDHGNYKAIPLINIDTMEFEWYIHSEETRNDPT